MLPRAKRARRTFRGKENGQVLVLVAGLISVFGGMTALAVDIGSYMADRRDLQNDADAIAHAAALGLPDSTAAQAAASSWATKNGIDSSEMTIEIIPQNPPGEPNPKVRVTLERDHGFTFARLVGISSAEVQTKAAAIKTTPAGGSGIVPLSVTEAALNGVGLGDEIILHYDANNIQNGNTGPIRIDDSGTGNCENPGQYCYGVRYGSDSIICADGSDPTYCSGPSTVNTEPGNKISGTRNAILDRLNNTDSQCDEFMEVFEDDPTTAEVGVYRITADCNPFLEGSYESQRVFIIPVIEQLCNGTCEVVITDFVLVWLERIGDGGCTGNDCEVVGRFVRVHQNVGLLAGTFDSSSNNQFVRLVE